MANVRKLMKRVACGLAAAILLSASGEALAFRLREYSTGEKVQQSGLIVAAVALSPAHPLKNARGTTYEFATFRVVAVVKGDAKSGELIEVVTRGRISESDLHRCCIVGDKYLLFLNGIGLGQYASVNGVFGAQRIGPAD